MPAPKVLLLATYSIIEPRHGGQLRTRHIYEEYRNAGIDVDYLGIFPYGVYPQHAETDLQLPGDLGERVLEDYEQVVYDHVWGLHIADMPDARSKLINRLRSGNYNFVQVDLLYVWPLVRRCLDELGPSVRRPKLVYSSQNIEHEMKRQVLSQLGAPGPAIERYGREVLDLERDIVRRADVLFAVSEADRDYLNRMGERTDCILARNGASVSAIPDETTDHWRPILPKEPFAVFISSAHLPNAVGFFSLFGESLAFLPPDHPVVIAGGVTRVIEANASYMKWAAINDARSMRFGIVDDIGIAALRRFAHVFVLPITAGGGSNIKTAEALLTGAYVLGTSTALRGYESYTSGPGVFVEDDPAAFRRRLLQLLQSDRLQLDPATLAARKNLLWDASLAPMPTKLLKTSVFANS